MSDLAPLADLAVQNAIFAAIVLIYLSLSMLHRRGYMPRWLAADVPSMLLCVALTALTAMAFIGVVNASLELPLPGWGCAVVAAVTAIATLAIEGWAFSRLVYSETSDEKRAPDYFARSLHGA